jgi:hypothetical protein
MATLPIILTVQGERQVAATLRNLSGSVGRAGQEMGKSMSAPMEHAQQKFAAVGKAAEKTTSRATRGLNVTNAAAGALASIGLRSMTDGYIAAGDEAEAANLKLEQMLAKRGQSGSLKNLQDLGVQMSRLTGMDDDQFAESGAHLLSYGLNAQQISEIMPGLVGQSHLMGQSLGSVANAFGKAFASGNLGALKRTGMTFSQADLKAVDAAKNISEAAGQLELFKRAQDSLKGYALSAGGGLSKAQIERGYHATQMGNFQESIGQSAGRTRAALQRGFTPLAERITASPGATSVIGAGLEIGTQAAPLLAATAAIGQSLPVFSKAGELFGGVVRNVGNIAMNGASAVNALTGSSTGLRASGFAATFSGNAHALAAQKTRVAAMISANSLGKVGASLGALAVIAYGVNETLIGTKNATTMSDEELEAQGPLGKFHSRAGDLYEKYNYRGLKRQYDSASLDRQIADQNRKNAAKFGARRSRQGYEATVKVTMPQTQTDRAAKAY